MSTEDRLSLQAGLSHANSEQVLARNVGTNLPEGLGPFFDAVLDKSVEVLKEGFISRSPGGIFTRVMTRSPRYVFEVEMTRYKQEGNYDCNTVLARTPDQNDINKPYKYASFIRRDRNMRTNETFASKTGGLYGNDMTDTEKEDFAREYLKSQIDVALTFQRHEYYVTLFRDRATTQIEWPSQGIGAVMG